MTLGARQTKVLEDGFNLIIGWNGRILPLVQQLILANESNGGGCVIAAQWLACLACLEDVFAVSS